MRYKIYSTLSFYEMGAAIHRNNIILLIDFFYFVPFCKMCILFLLGWAFEHGSPLRTSLVGGRGTAALGTFGFIFEV